MGLGFNVGQLLGLAIGCLWMTCVAHDMGARLASIYVDVTVKFEGEHNVCHSQTPND